MYLKINKKTYFKKYVFYIYLKFKILDLKCYVEFCRIMFYNCYSRRIKRRWYKMRKQNNQKKKIYPLLFLFLIIIIGLGYAILTSKLSINTSVNYDSIKWNVGFSEAVDNGGSVKSIPSISEDKNSITIQCNIGTSTKSETCIAKATINNDSSFDIVLKDNLTITSNEAYIESVDIVWIDSNTNTGNVKVNDLIPKGVKQNVEVRITTKKLLEDTIPSSSLSVPITIGMNWGEADK